MQVQVNSLWCLVHGIWDFCPWASGDKHCLATKCVCIANSIHYGIGSRDSVLTSGRPGSKHCSALKCMHGSDSNAHAVFQVQVNPVQLTLVIDSWFLVWIKSAWQGCHVAHKSPSGIPGITQCSAIQLPMQLVHALGSIRVWIKSAQQGHHVAYKLPQGIRYESMQSINLVGTRC